MEQVVLKLWIYYIDKATKNTYLFMKYNIYLACTKTTLVSSDMRINIRSNFFKSDQ